MGTPTLITRDDPQLKKAPLGTDSVVAVGRIDPDPAGDKIFNLDGRDVIVPAGRVALSKAPGAESSTFIQSEHLIYNESQVRAAHITPLCSPAPDLVILVTCLLTSRVLHGCLSTVRSHCVSAHQVRLRYLVKMQWT